MNDCIEWTKCKDRDGYGKLKVNGKYLRAHRYFYELKNGPIPNKMIILHSCDNPSCINIEHLKIGTHKENTKDMMIKKRHPIMFLDCCSKGHQKKMHERCKTCDAVTSKKYRDRKKIINAQASN